MPISKSTNWGRKEKMITYTESLRGVSHYSLDGFCEGWQQPLTPLQLRSILKHSTYRILAMDTEHTRIVGIITALSDKIHWAFIPYLEVIPAYQKQGIGKRLMELMIEKTKGIVCIDLTCDTEMQAFYEQFGMVASHGMILRRYMDEK
ncbi:Phospholipiddiacylglycerol acyltransferase protein [uncultured spirochete]|jgi:GNAT superfamily N-acetyltransferase|uniref:Phospholipiddiacylglycerol acyltransferase protein n=2 Tax=Spirochaetales TaxID=136 RepID=A0A3P3XF65_9SPIR|nr:Phospholipiddiacylglycerol acyltransferase protein [uncultured spirochete]SLM15402.1 Phospholipiddiacylglycerol acyltransferase protein [uncultured spirochete]